MRDRELSNFPSINSIIQFVRLGGHEKLTRGVGVEFKGQKYQENVISNSDYSILQKVLFFFLKKVVFGIFTGKTSVSCDSSKITKLLKLSLNSTGSLFLLGCLNPNEANFEECLNTLSFLDRCKHFEEGKQNIEKEKKPEENKIRMVTSGKQNLVQKLQDQIQEKRIRINSLESDYSSKLEKLSKYLGIRGDMKKLLTKQDAQGN